MSISDGTAIFPNSFMHLILDRLYQGRAVHFPLLQNDEGLDGLADELVRFADHGRFRHGLVTDQRAFHFGGAEPVAGHFDHVIGATHEPHVAVCIFVADVAGGVAVRDRVPIGLVAFRIFIDGPHHRRPGLFDDGKTAGVGGETVALAVHDIGFDAEKGSGGGAWLQGDGRQGGNQDGACFGLPPGVHDRFVPTGRAMEPFPGFRIDRFAHAAKNAKGREIVFLGPVFSIAHEQANGGGGRIENRDAIAFDQIPPAARVRIVRLAFSCEDRGAIEEGAIHDITVAGDPARVGDTKIHIVLFEIEDVFRGDVGSDHVPTVNMDHAFRFARGAGRIEDIQRMFCIQRFGLADRFLILQPVVPIDFLRRRYGAHQESDAVRSRHVQRWGN